MAKPSSGAHLIVEHREAWDAARLAAFFAKCGPPRYEGGTPVTPEDHARWAAAAEAAGWAQAYAWDLPFVRGTARVPVALRLDPFRVRDHGAVAFKVLAPQPERWLRFDLANVPLEDEAALDWLAAYLGRMAEAFPPSFAFADTGLHLAANADTDPRGLTWPVTLLGPDHVRRIGRDKILAAPAQVREVAPDTFLLALAPSPFDARARALETLGAHLGRRARS